MSVKFSFQNWMRRAAALMVAAIALVQGALADDPPAAARPAPAAEAAGDRRPNPRGAAPALSKAEQITRLQRQIAADEKQLAELNAELSSPESEYVKAEAEFKAIDERYVAEQQEIDRRKAAGEELGLKRLEDTHAETEIARKLAHERFDLAIQTRKTSREQMTAIEEKLKQNKAALDAMTGTAAPAAAPAETPAVVPPAPTDQPAPAASAPAAPLSPAMPVPVPAPAQATSPAPQPAPTVAAPPAPAAAGNQASFLGSQTSGDRARERAHEEVSRAEQAAHEKHLAAEQAMKTAQSLSDRLAALDKDIASQQELLAASRRKAELALQARDAHEREYNRIKDEGGLEETQAARNRRDQSSEAVIRAQDEVTSRMDRLQELQADRASLKQEEFAAVTAAKERQLESIRAQEKVVSLKNPFAMHNMLQWLLDHGPRLTLIILGMFILQMFIKVAMKRVVDIMMQRGFRGTYEESEDRAKTLVSVFQNAASTTVVAGGTLMIFEEAGIAVAPLMGGAAVIGLAVAFGAQNLIRDYFYGFVILLENQYKINDVLRIGSVSGQVERITLRMTVLRDMEGCVHFIPNGKIECVTNMTHGWSRAVFDIHVAYDEDTDRVVDALMDVAKGLRSEPQYSRIILEDAEMLGVDSFGDSSVVIKFRIKTRPLKQWLVKREMLRRIKKKFNELKIEIPFPQRVVHHRGEQMSRLIHEQGLDDEGTKAA